MFGFLAKKPRFSDDEIEAALAKYAQPLIHAASIKNDRECAIAGLDVIVSALLEAKQLFQMDLVPGSDFHRLDWCTTRSPIDFEYIAESIRGMGEKLQHFPQLAGKEFREGISVKGWVFPYDLKSL